MTATEHFTPFDATFLRMAAEISTDGFTIVNVGYPDASYSHSYTVGLHRLDHPELIFFDYCQEHVRLTALFAMQRALEGDPLPIGRHARIAHDEATIALDPLDPQWVDLNADRVQFWWHHFGRHESPHLAQVVVADAAGRLPWDRNPKWTERRLVRRQRPSSWGRTAKRRRRR